MDYTDSTRMCDPVRHIEWAFLFLSWLTIRLSFFRVDNFFLEGRSYKLEAIYSFDVLAFIY